MPKLKTNKSASKRFKKTKSGKFKRTSSFSRHLMTSKSPKRRRNFRRGGSVSETDMVNVRGMLPYS
ncbi:MAG: 50S ribosomal protein L35 [Candidatus Hydrogenedentota bacterium]|nr:MAG: 50S ribosomal protein L35 [Candidatus Hydrogenedentota bacterium]